MNNTIQKVELEAFWIGQSLSLEFTQKHLEKRTNNLIFKMECYSPPVVYPPLVVRHVTSLSCHADDENGRSDYNHIKYVRPNPIYRNSLYIQNLKMMQPYIGVDCSHEPDVNFQKDSEIMV